MQNDAFLALMKAIEEEIAIRTEGHMGLVPPRPILPSEYREQPIEHIDFDSLPISEYTGLPYDPELIVYLGPNHARSKRKFRLFRKREKVQPKQEHVSLFEVLEDNR
jgi:hypothetical protein